MKRLSKKKTYYKLCMAVAETFGSNSYINNEYKPVALGIKGHIGDLLRLLAHHQLALSPLKLGFNVLSKSTRGHSQYGKVVRVFY